MVDGNSALYISKNMILNIISIIHVFLMFNSVFLNFGFPYIYMVFVALLLFFVIIQGFNKSQFVSYSLIWLYLFLLSLILLINIVFFDKNDKEFLAFGLYTFPILCWLFIYTSAGHFSIDYSEVLSRTLFFSGLVGYFSVLQYFYSPTIFGAIARDSNALIWAENMSFEEYSVFFRASSTLGSPQVLGLFCAFSIILSLRYRKKLNNINFNFSVLGLLLGGVLSASKTFFVIVFLYMLFYLMSKFFSKPKKFFFLISLVILFFISSSFYSSIVPRLERVFSVSSILEQEKRDSRLQRYHYIIQNTEPVLGNGLGSITNRSIVGLRAAESYVLKLYYETGVFPLFLFLLIFCVIFFCAAYISFLDGIIVFLIFLGLIVVHAFESPVFFIFWGYLLSFFRRSVLRGDVA